MDRRAIDDRRRIGTMKAAINMYGERILEGNSSLKKPQIGLPENSSSRAKELHKAKREMVRYKESRRVAESVTAQAETELSKAKKTVKDLALQIEESNSKAKAKMRDMERLKKSGKRGDKSSGFGSSESNKYAEMMREIECVKQELSKLKLDMAYVLEAKMQAKKEIEVSNSKLETNLKSVEAIGKEIEEVNEEQVLVELARIEALKESGEIEVQREKEGSEFSHAMEENRKKMKDVVEEIDRSNDVESKLAVTLSDVNVLQNELKLVKEIEKKVLRNDSLKHSGGSFRKSDQLEELPSLNSITEELEEAKKELASIKQEGFQFMASMEIIRSELKHVTGETVQLKKMEHKADLTFQNLNSKLLRAKTKLEASTAAEEKAKAIVSNLSLTLEQLKTETEVAKQ
ncbi:hypothetical protein JCGZ_13004 [Jatropha curcas]|uniref:Uncharacterized protein n=1 Tax=Jatropha curcas TaxID=180498 RepID=A0A067KD69_JATCU|nr:hypothetical protein JCGZ_13004 [Jatropha curcas]